MMVALEGAGLALKGGTKHPLLLVVYFTLSVSCFCTEGFCNILLTTL